MDKFKLISNYELKGDQPQALEKLADGITKGKKNQVLLGVTGSGKTFTMAQVIQKLNMPTLVISPNKTLAGQLYNEFKELFPDNCVEYFVSYYDYYQPEAYVPSTDTFIEKDASINERIDRLRHSATSSLLQRKDVIVVASVSCIYGIGSPESYRKLAINISRNDKRSRDDFLKCLINIQYQRNDIDFSRGTFRVRGENVDVFPASFNDQVIRISFYDDIVQSISLLDPLMSKVISNLDNVLVFPASHYVVENFKIDDIIKNIKCDLEKHLIFLKNNGKLLEAQRLEQRTKYDLEMLKETGYCSGIENYSRYMDGRKEGEPAYTLIDFFPKNYILFIDESHITVPQIGGMYHGDSSRKNTLIEFGFRLPSAKDNRPLNFEEFCHKTDNVIYVSATPGDYEIKKSDNIVVEQIIRPTGLIEPQIFIKPSENQVNDLKLEIEKILERGEKALVTTLTKKMAEKLAEYYDECGIRARYLHSEIETIERMKIISDLRDNKFDVLIGINLLREGLDIPEVSLVAILEADREGFLRSRRSLIQTFGRAARNTNGRVILYADKRTNAIDEAIKETDRRRIIQKKYNEENNITPQTIIKSRKNILLSIYEKDYVDVKQSFIEKNKKYLSKTGIGKQIKTLKSKMMISAKKYHFEEAAAFRDQIKELELIFEQFI